MTQLVKGGVKEIRISAVVTRADGTIDDLGVISRKKMLDQHAVTALMQLRTNVKRIAEWFRS